MTTFFRDLARLLCAGLITFIIVGFLGHRFATGDSLAVFRIEAAVLLVPAAALAYLAGARRTPVIALGAAAITGATILPFMGNGPEIEEPSFILQQHNMLFSNAQRAGFVEAMTDGPAQVVALQEVGYLNTDVLLDDTDSLPQLPISAATPGAASPSLRAIPWPAPRLRLRRKNRVQPGCRLDTPKGPVTVASIHLRWPWPKPQFWQVALWSKRKSGKPAERPLIVAGDFNMVPWAAAIGRVADCSGNGRSRGRPALRPTYLSCGGPVAVFSDRQCHRPRMAPGAC